MMEDGFHKEKYNTQVLLFLIFRRPLQCCLMWFHKKWFLFLKRSKGRLHLKVNNKDGKHWWILWKLRTLLCCVQFHTMSIFLLLTSSFLRKKYLSLILFEMSFGEDVVHLIVGFLKYKSLSVERVKFIDCWFAVRNVETVDKRGHVLF